MKQESFDNRDVQFMRRALRLAQRGRGWVEPNPMVGCVIARGSKVLGEGFHRRFGGPHAEINALRAAAGAVRSATAYVTLEPCSHFGKTPPCADALIEAGVRRVVAAMKDPHGDVAGRGIRKLRAAGIRVDVGCLRDRAVALNRPYLTLIKHGRPHVTLKWAQSIDGQITTPPGEPKAISSEASHRWVHRLRARIDGILIGVGTALADDPLLTARGVQVRRIATRIVLDSHLRIRPTSRLVTTAPDIPTLVATTRAGRNAHPKRAEKLSDAGVEIVVCRPRSGRVHLGDLLHRLAERNMSNILIEGGGQVIANTLFEGLSDEAFIFVAPSLIGGGTSPIAIPPAAAARASVSSRRVGVDVLHHVLLCG